MDIEYDRYLQKTAEQCIENIADRLSRTRVNGVLIVNQPACQISHIIEIIVSEEIEAIIPKRRLSPEHYEEIHRRVLALGF